MNTKVFLFTSLFFIAILSNRLSAQLKIGNQARTLTAPNITLLELSNDATVSYAKGFVMPITTTIQRDNMLANNNNTIPMGMTIYNKDADAIQVYTTNGNKWISYETVSSIVKSVQNASNTSNPYLVEAVDGQTTVFTIAFSTQQTLSQNGTFNIIYNHIPLRQGVDFTVNTTTKKISFLTIIPENFNDFDRFEAQYNL